jgi:fermentation-respiration switch protein FrsA (DUF1100 family)
MIGLIERRLLFRPQTQAESWSDPPPELRARDVWFELPGKVRAHAWWCEPKGWSPDHGATHYSHGNAGNLSQRAESVRRWMTLMRQAVLIYDYPGYGRSSGKPSEAGCYTVGETAFNWIVGDRGVSPGRVLFYGGSLGGAIAIELATRQPYRALILVSAFTSVPDMAKKQYPWLPVRPFIRNRFENLAKIPRCPGRVFIAHGTADRYVPYRMGEQLFAAAPEPKRFFPMVDHDHYHSPGPEFYTELVTFLEQYSRHGTT